MWRVATHSNFSAEDSNHEHGVQAGSSHGAARRHVLEANSSHTMQATGKNFWCLLKMTGAAFLTRAGALLGTCQETGGAARCSCNSKPTWTR